MPSFTIGTHTATVCEAAIRKSKSGKRHIRLHFENSKKARIARDFWLTTKAINTTLTILCEGFGLPEPDAPDFPSKLQAIVGRQCQVVVDEEIDQLHGVPMLRVRWVEVGDCGVPETPSA